jgi:hypothetical protein
MSKYWCSICNKTGNVVKVSYKYTCDCNLKSVLVIENLGTIICPGCDGTSISVRANNERLNNLNWENKNC